MRRALASFLLAVIGVPLIGVPLLVESLPAAPACCLRNGQHHCEAAGMGSSSESPAVVSARCPLWPVPAVASRQLKAPLPAVAVQGSSPLLSQPGLFTSRQRRFPAAAKDPIKKRGPPPPLD
jgi:hypothetical protein